MAGMLEAVLVYMSVLVLVGAWRSRRVRTGDDFLVAGRRLPARVLVFTLLATWVGSGSLFGGAGLGYRSGFSALWQSAGAWAGIALVYFIAPRVRRIAQYTVPDILELRYGPWARVLGTLTTVLAYATIAAYQFRGGGRLLALVAGVDPDTGALITAIFCILFTSLAGMLSIAYLDVGNGLVMTIAVMFGVAFLVGDAGGLSASLAALEPHQVSLFGDMGPQAAFALFLPTMFLLLGEANMYQKFFSARDERAARLAVVGWIAGTIVVETLIDSTGIFGSLAIGRAGCGGVGGDRPPRRHGRVAAGARRAAGLRRGRDRRLHREQLPAHAVDEPHPRRLPAVPQSGGDRSAGGPLHARDRGGGRRPRLRRRQLLSHHPRDGALGLHDVRGRDHAGVARRAALEAGDARRRRRVHRGRDAHHPRLGERRPVAGRGRRPRPTPSSCRRRIRRLRSPSRPSSSSVS